MVGLDCYLSFICLELAIIFVLFAPRKKIFSSI